MAVFLYNTMSRRKEAFTPLDGKRARMYTCGPTVYHYAHLGNLRTYIFEDILKRTLLYNHIPVLHVMNITDVGHLTSDADEGEDKMEKGARREGRSVWDIAQHYTEAFQQDLQRLGIMPPDVWCKATDHIPEQIAQIRQLTARGHTYQIDDGIYFDTGTLDDYGKLARLDLEQLKAGARVEVAHGKRNPADFALWKFSPKGATRAMEWIYEGPRAGQLITDRNRATLTREEEQSRGFPGWHIECSAMSIKYLGEQFDIHCGGIDHIPVHHTNEIAQAEAATGVAPWVSVWMHGEFLVIDKGKMAKSGENFLTLQTLIDKGYAPPVYRYFCLTANYRQQLAFSWEAIETARSGLDSIRNKLLDLRQASPDGDDTQERIAQHKHAFTAAISDDLNMPQALAALWAMLRDERLSGEMRAMLACDFDRVLGLGLSTVGEEEIPDDIKALAAERHQARQRKDWAASDRLRDEARARGYLIEDTADGYRIRPA